MLSLLKKLIVIILIFTCLIQPTPAFADHGHGHGSQGLAIASLAVGAAALFYSAGVFYRTSQTGYVVVQPPVGTVVQALPGGYTTVAYNGVPYYVYGNVYYLNTPAGYTVVNPPVVQTVGPTVAAPAPPQPAAVAPAAAAPAAPGAQDSSSDSLEVRIPNGNGSYVLVPLQKTGQGYLGPQGEFYPVHPTVEELKQKYQIK